MSTRKTSKVSSEEDVLVRISRDRLFMEIARLYALRSSCPRAQVGAVSTRDGRVVAAGYNGAPAGRLHCLDVGCDMEHGHCVRAVHAEANLIAWAARTGTALQGARLFCTNLPCLACTKLVINAGIEQVTFDDLNHGGGPEALNLLRSAGLVDVEP